MASLRKQLRVKSLVSMLTNTGSIPHAAKTKRKSVNTDLKHTFVSRADSNYRLIFKDFYLHEISKSYYLWKCAQISCNSSKGRNYLVLYAYF